jgi:thiomorpholine-carboxylate dehydrogenase
MTLFLDDAAVRANLDREALIPVLRAALIDFSGGNVTQPVRQILAQHGGFLGVMPASGDSLGVKLISLYPDNAEKGLATHMALIVLLRPETGEPLAVMDGEHITEMRTAAVSAVATDLLAAPDARALAILGSGAQARGHFEMLQKVRDFSDVRVWSRTPEHAAAFAAEIGASSTSAEDAVRGADVVVTATGAAEPVLNGAWLKPGAHVNAIGAYRPDRRELDDAAMANTVIVDSREAAVKESGDVILSGAEIYAELGEVLAGTKPVPNSDTTVFKSLGLAVEDVVTANLVYNAAVKKSDTGGKP